MFGVVFDGHPDLRRILMPEDYEGFPQRRDFPVGGEPVLFTVQRRARNGLHAVSALERLPPARRGRSTRRPAAAERDPEQELLTINFGPHHPATHGVLRLLVHARGRGRPRRQADHRLRPHRHREDRRGQELLEGHPRRRADGLPRLLLQRVRVLRRGRDAARPRGAQARAVPARHPHGAQPDQEPPRVARDERAGPRRDLDVLVLLPRARADPRPLRDVARAQRMHTRYIQVGGVAEDIPPGWVEKVPRVHEGRCASAPTSTARCSTATRSSCSACATSCIGAEGAAARARRHRPAAARRRRAVGPAQGRAVLLLRGLRLQDPGRHRGRQLRPLRGAPSPRSTSPATSSTRRSTACPRARTSPTTARSSCRRATSWRRRWRRSSTTSSSSPRATACRRARCTSRSRGRAASTAASCAPTARPSPRACTCATRRS